MYAQAICLCSRWKCYMTELSLWGLVGKERYLGSINTFWALHHEGQLHYSLKYSLASTLIKKILGWMDRPLIWLSGSNVLMSYISFSFFSFRIDLFRMRRQLWLEVFVHHVIQVGTKISVFAQGSVPNRMHFRHHGFLQSIIPLVAVELNTECQTPYDCGLGIGVAVLALGAVSWYRNLEELLSCYVSTVQLNYLLFQRIHRSRLTQLWENPTQAFGTDGQNFP